MTTKPPLARVQLAKVPTVRVNPDINPRNIRSLEASMPTSHVLTADELVDRITISGARDETSQTPVIEKEGGYREDVSFKFSDTGTCIRPEWPVRFGNAFLQAFLGGGARCSRPQYELRMYPSYDRLYREGYARKWGQLVRDLLLSEFRGYHEYSELDFIFSRKKKKALDVWLKNNYGISFRQFRRQLRPGKIVSNEGPAHLASRMPSSKAPLTGRDVYDIVRMHADFSHSDILARWASEAWSVRAAGQLDLSSKNLMGAANFFDGFVEVMTGSHVPHIDPNDLVGTEFTPSLMRLIASVEYYLDEKMPTPCAAALAYSARYYVETEQTENAMSMFKALRSYFDCDIAMFEHVGDVVKRLRGADPSDENDVLIALHERLMPGSKKQKPAEVVADVKEQPAIAQDDVVDGVDEAVSAFEIATDHFELAYLDEING